VARLAMIFRRGRLTALSLLLASLVAPAHAENCDRILSSKDPILLRGSSVTLFRGAVKPGLIAFHILRGEDSVKVLQMTGTEAEPVIEARLKGVLVTHWTNLKTKQAIDYEYPSVEGSLTEGTQMRYTRVLKQNGEAKATETGIIHIGERGVMRVGECEVEVIAIDGEIKSDQAPTRATRLLYAPRLGYFVKSESASSLSNGLYAFSFKATSVELTP
jgi:hypothetical protein